MAKQKQLTLDVGGDVDEPAGASFTVTGRIATVVEQLDMDDEVMVVIARKNGVVIVESPARVTRVQFDKHEREGEQPWIERVHRLKVVDE